MNQWSKGIAHWRIGNVEYLSVVFSWDLQKALDMQAASKRKVIIGGPAAKLAGMDVPELPYPVLPFHNPLATFTTRGCPNSCAFCAVPRLEGDLVELPTWEVKPVVCDNNLLAASRRHFDRVVDSLKPLPYVDFNQGLEAALFTNHHASRMAELKGVRVRFAMDSITDELPVIDAIVRARAHGLKDISVYVLIGFNDTQWDAKERLELVRTMGLWPNPMRFQPIGCAFKDSYVEQGWTDAALSNMMRYYSKLRWLDYIPFEDYKGQQEREKLL